MRILTASAADIGAAAALLRAGNPVAIPTETVYGLAGDARNPDALRAIFAAKGRPLDHPLIVHIGTAAALDAWAEDIPPVARTLASRFWPGPITLVLRRRADVSDLVTGGQDTVALRVPAHPVALAVLQEFGGALCAPSANRFGRISPTCAEHVRAELDGRIAAVVDGGACHVGIESTIVDLSGGDVVIRRPGVIGADLLAAHTGRHVAVAGSTPPVRVPGALDSHYAPATPARLVEPDSAEPGMDPEAFVLGFGDLPAGMRGIAMPTEPAAYAAALYACLRRADAAGAARILVVAPPHGDAWLAVRDRLGRACHRTG
jgi:L-threonylcarbamoyladenylate synthase